MKIDTEALKKKLGENRVEEVIDELVEKSKKTGEKYNQSILIQSNYKTYKDNLIIGIENSNTELQKIKLGLINLLDAIAKEENPVKKTSEEPQSKLDKIRQAFAVTDMDAINLIFQIGESKHRWRKGKTLELKMGLSEAKLARLARSNPEIFERGQLSGGEIGYRLKSNYEAIYKSKVI